jgi:uncharacterized protein YxeA
MKKIFIIIFSLMLVFSLSGCGSKSASSPDILLEDTDDLLEDFDDYTELPYDDQPDSFMDTKSTSNFNNFSGLAQSLAVLQYDGLPISTILE